jgi:hypothetical protein
LSSSVDMTLLNSSGDITLLSSSVDMTLLSSSSYTSISLHDGSTHNSRTSHLSSLNYSASSQSILASRHTLSAQTGGSHSSSNANSILKS